MCGFVGYLLQGDGSQPELKAWGEVIAHRGPDQAGTAQDEAFGIGTRRLSIVDLSPAGAQPMRGPRYLIGFNGEIYNHQVLRTKLLAASKITFRSDSDTETVLQCLECWGIETTLARLNGIYALAIWDTLKGKLTLARDPMGTKPLYYVPGDSGLYFASELKALRAYSSSTLSKDGLALYLVLGYTPSPYTMVEGIHKLRPGEVLSFTEMGEDSHDIVPEPWTAPLALDFSSGKLTKAVRVAVEAAVTRQLMADVPVGVFLSGGVDSTILAAVAAKHIKEMFSFSIRPAQAELDAGAGRDADLASLLANAKGFRHHELSLRPETLVEEPETLYHVDEPTAEPYFLAELALSKAACAAGVPVVLTGHGADEVFLGYESYIALQKWGYYNRVPLLRQSASVLAVLPFLKPEVRDNFRGVAKGWRVPLLERYLLENTHFSVEEAAALIGLPTDYVGQLVGRVLSRGLSRAHGYFPIRGPMQALEVASRLDLSLNVPDYYNLRLDRASMAASVEARVPFQDLELLNVALRLPYTSLLHGGQKGMLKSAFHDVLPRNVLVRKKQRFQAPVVSWLRGPLQPWALYWQQQAEQWLQSAAVQGRSSHKRTAYRVWMIAFVEAWRQSVGLEV